MHLMNIYYAPCQAVSFTQRRSGGSAHNGTVHRRPPKGGGGLLQPRKIVLKQIFAQ